MRRSPAFLPLIAALVLLAGPAAALADMALVDSTVGATVDLRRASDGGVYAVTTIETRWGFRLTGEADLLVNGNVLKLDPIDTTNLTIFSEFVGDGTFPVNVCLVFRGSLEVSGDATRLVDRQDCDLYMPKVSPPDDGRTTIPGRLSPDVQPQRLLSLRATSRPLATRQR